MAQVPQDPTPDPALVARARAAFDFVADQTVAEPTLYTEDTEVLFALIVQAVQMYADATDSAPAFVLSDVAENFEGSQS